MIPMGTLVFNLDLITRWFPTMVVIVAIAAVILSVGWLVGAWKYQLIVGVPSSFALTLLTGLVIEVFNLVPDQFPMSFYAWAWLIWFSLTVVLLGWTQAHWALRTFSVIA